MSKYSNIISELVADLKKQEIQPGVSAPGVRTLREIHCHDCGASAELAGYAWRLTPICAPCRTTEDVRVTGKRFERREAKRR